jgi:hypothetical protein
VGVNGNVFSVLGYTQGAMCESRDYTKDEIKSKLDALTKYDYDSVIAGCVEILDDINANHDLVDDTEDWDEDDEDWD